MDDKHTDKYIKIRIRSLHPQKPTTFDVFVLINNKYVHYLRAGDYLEDLKIQKLGRSETEVFYIREADRAAFKAYVHSQLGDASLSVKDKALILREGSYSLVEELFENPDVYKALDESKDTVKNFVDFMDEEPEALATLIGLSSHDFYTYNHSLDVCVYSIGLGQAAGYADKVELMELARGALFHDIGKRHVNAEIICKKGPLNDTEWAQMKNHPLYGLQILNDYPDAGDSMKACVFEHHENHLGNGYPQQLSGDDIHPMARIVALTDTYDALTTKRSYNVPMSPSDALVLMKEKLFGRFDPELLKAMYSILFQLKAS